MPSLRELYLKFKPCIVRIVVRNSEGDLSTGTGFHICNGLVVTARHVAEEKIDEITREFDEATLTVNEIFYHRDTRVDLAVLATDFDKIPFPTTLLLNRNKREETDAYIPLGSHLDDWLKDDFVLSKVLIMGYPRIPFASKAFLVTAEAEVNATIETYNSPHPHFIISTIARGGFSGCPVISDEGVVIAIVTEALCEGDKDAETGFFAAISIEPLISILIDRGDRPRCVDEDIWREVSERHTES